VGTYHGGRTMAMRECGVGDVVKQRGAVCVCNAESHLGLVIKEDHRTGLRRSG